MNGIKFRYYFVNIAVIVAAVALFLYNYRNIGDIFRNLGTGHIAAIVIAVIIVHMVKAVRLYLALYGTDISFSHYLKVYCKVTPVSMILPYKLGEFYRMYCFGKTLNNFLRGIIIVLLDRFMDTIALITMVILVWIFFGGRITSLTYLLMIFLVFALIIYHVFPGVYLFWKRYVLRAKATERKLKYLKLLDTLNCIYLEIKGVSEGRGIVLYFLSLIAWGAEIGIAALREGLFRDGNLNIIIAEYMISAMGGNESAELKQFVFVSVVLMIVIYAMSKVWDRLPEGTVQR